MIMKTVQNLWEVAKAIYIEENFLTQRKRYSFKCILEKKKCLDNPRFCHEKIGKQQIKYKESRMKEIKNYNQ